MNKERIRETIIPILAFLVVAVSAALVLQLSGKNKPAPVAVAPIKNQNENLPSAQNTPPVATNTNTIVIPEKPTPITINWLSNSQPIEISKINALFNIKDASSSDNFSNYPQFYSVGAVSSGPYAGDSLYYFSDTCSVDSCGITGLAIAAPEENKLVIADKYSSTDELTPENFNNNYYPDIFKLAVHDPNITIPDLAAPETITIKNSAYTAVRTRNAVGAPNNTTATATIGKTSDGLDIYTPTPSQVNINQTDIPDNLDIRLKNSEFVPYELIIPFYADKRVPAITWNDKSVNDVDYSPYSYTGCGNDSYLSEVSIPSSFLTPAGKTSNGEIIYVYKNSNRAELKNTYDLWNTWSANNNKKPSYSEFLAMRPYIFWIDPFGRTIRWARPDLYGGAECGKPIVYLYPTKAEFVSVKLGNNISVEKSEPAYGKGWNVTAEPNGTLTTADGQTYPYLYWDGKGATYPEQTTGFVVARKDVAATFKEKLAQLGLNAKEISDFNDFWLPIVSKSPYALISFVPQAEWSKAAPLAISPAPQTVIRVFMDWKPLSEPIEVAPETLPPTPQRTGFTAVEWGGLLYN